MSIRTQFMPLQESMTRSDLVEELAARFGHITHRDAEHAVKTILDAVSEASTTRLGGATFYLINHYGWPIEATSKAAGCRDGRVAWVSEYWLPVEIIARAMAAGAGQWCAQVRAARRARRAPAAQARREAERANAARKARRHCPGQQALFEGAGNRE